MGSFVRILLGGLIATVALWAAVVLHGLLLVWCPRSWWAHHAAWVIDGFRALVLLPLVVVPGYILRLLFKQDALLNTLVSTLIALVAAFIWDPVSFGPALRVTWRLFVPFLIGPPLVVLVMRCRRSNSRWSGP